MITLDERAARVRDLLKRIPSLDEDFKILRADEPVPFDELAEEGIVLDPKYPLRLGPTVVHLLRIALNSKLELYETLSRIQNDRT